MTICHFVTSQFGQQSSTVAPYVVITLAALLEACFSLPTLHTCMLTYQISVSSMGCLELLFPLHSIKTNILLLDYWNNKESGSAIPQFSIL